MTFLVIDLKKDWEIKENLIYQNCLEKLIKDTKIELKFENESKK